MKTRFIYFLCLCLLWNLSICQTTVPEGEVYGNWNVTGSPYLIDGNINVPADCTLIIDPGVTVDFQGNYEFLVYGFISAQGTITDSIFFMATQLNGHKGIKIYSDSTVTDSILITYCHFEDGNGMGSWPNNCGSAIAVVDYDRVRIQNCLMIDNQAYLGSPVAGGALAFDRFNGIVCHNTFIDNRSSYGGAIMVWNSSNPHIHHNKFLNNRATFEAGAIMIWGDCEPLIEYNEFIGNRANQFGGAISTFDASEPIIRKNLFDENISVIRGGAIECWSAGNSLIINNTFVRNHSIYSGGAVSIMNSSCPVFINNIFWDNHAGNEGHHIYNSDSLCIPDFYYNDVQFGRDSVGGYIPEGQWRNNIDEYPEFVDTASGDFQLLWGSPCIDAGVDTIFDPDGTISDMGAYFYLITGLTDMMDSRASLEFSVYPVPVVNECIMIISNSENELSSCNMSVFDVRGLLVYNVRISNIKNGEKVYRYDASQLATGTYFIRLQAGNEVVTKKIIKN